MASFHDFALTFLRRLDAECAHRLTIKALAAGLGPRASTQDPPILASRVFGLAFPNPMGLAAGFDKNGEALGALHALGFGFVEIGSVTPRPQPGNPRPRLFRLTEDRAVINRMGFNNHGAERVAERVRRSARRGLLGVNLGANKDSADRIADYESGLRSFAGLADFFVINVSSPNTPGLRDLQGAEALDALLGRLSALKTAPLLLKIAPDLSPGDPETIAEAACRHGIDGLVVSNTTTARPPELKSRHASESGGLSGAPLFARSTDLIATMHRLTGGGVPIIGVGGVSSGKDAYAKIRAGASLVELYTAMVYEGPGIVGQIKTDLARLLKADGFSSVAEAVGADCR